MIDIIDRDSAMNPDAIRMSLFSSFPCLVNHCMPIRLESDVYVSCRQIQSIPLAPGVSGEPFLDDGNNLSAKNAVVGILDQRRKFPLNRVVIT